MTSIASSFAISSEWNLEAADKLRIVSCTPFPCQGREGTLGAPDYNVTAADSRGLAEDTRVRTSGPSSVMAMVCSACALGFPSTVTTVQPSAKTLVKCEPRLTIG